MWITDWQPANLWAGCAERGCRARRARPLGRRNTVYTLATVTTIGHYIWKTLSTLARLCSQSWIQIMHLKNNLVFKYFCNFVKNHFPKCIIVWNIFFSVVTMSFYFIMMFSYYSRLKFFFPIVKIGKIDVCSLILVREGVSRNWHIYVFY